jgi:DtxR family Mn-dependent transcriptional regulator
VGGNRDAHGSDEYLEAIYELGEEGGKVAQARIAQRLGVSRPAVSEQVKRLVRRKLVRVGPARQIELTGRGYSIAEDAVRRHRMTERFLTDVLKLPWHLAHEEASRFQSGISEEVERRMLALLRGPATCPHGNPIPGTGAVFRTDLAPLNEVEAGREVILERLLEDVELHTDVLRYFEERGVMPGATLRVTEVLPDGTRTIRVGRASASIGAALADNLWVRPLRRSSSRTAGRGRRKAKRS